jgi:hypothetical protein
MFFLMIMLEHTNGSFLYTIAFLPNKNAVWTS